MQVPVLETARLRVREFEPGDLAAAHAGPTAEEPLPGQFDLAVAIARRVFGQGTLPRRPAGRAPSPKGRRACSRARHGVERQDNADEPHVWSSRQHHSSVPSVQGTGRSSGQHVVPAQRPAAQHLTPPQHSPPPDS